MKNYLVGYPFLQNGFLFNKIALKGDLWDAFTGLIPVFRKTANF